MNEGGQEKYQHSKEFYRLDRHHHSFSCAYSRLLYRTCAGSIILNIYLLFHVYLLYAGSANQYYSILLYRPVIITTLNGSFPLHQQLTNAYK